MGKKGKRAQWKTWGGDSEQIISVGSWDMRIVSFIVFHWLCSLLIVDPCILPRELKASCSQVLWSLLSSTWPGWEWVSEFGESQVVLDTRLENPNCAGFTHVSWEVCVLVPWEASVYQRFLWCHQNCVWGRLDWPYMSKIPREKMCKAGRLFRRLIFHSILRD